jgi:hypothetical protein
VWQIGALERFADRDQHEVLNEIDGTQVRTDQFEIIRTQRGQKSVR